MDSSYNFQLIYVIIFLNSLREMLQIDFEKNKKNSPRTKRVMEQY
jgi:hypothetical protein